MRLAAVLVLAVGLHEPTTTWARIAYLNVAAVHTNRGVSSPISPAFPYVTASPGRSRLDEAVLWAPRGLGYAGASNRLVCVMLRAHSVSMAWTEARALVESGACNDASRCSFKVPRPILEGLRKFEHGDLVAARRELRRAMLAGSGLLDLSLDSWLERVQSAETANLAKSPQTKTPRFLGGRRVDDE